MEWILEKEDLHAEPENHVQQCPLQKGHISIPDNNKSGCGVNDQAQEWLRTSAPGGSLTFPVQAFHISRI